MIYPTKFHRSHFDISLWMLCIVYDSVKMTIRYDNVSLYVYGLSTVVSSVSTAFVYTQVEEDSYVLPLVVNMLFLFNICSLYSIVNDNVIIKRIQILSVMCSSCVCMYLVNIHIWDIDHYFCCVSCWIISICYMFISLATYANKEWFGSRPDSRRLILPVSMMVIFLFPIDPYHESMIMLQIIVFILSFFITLVYLTYTNNSIIMDPGSDPIWYMLCMHIPILMMNSSVSMVYSIIFTGYTLKRILDKYILDITLSSPENTCNDSTLNKDLVFQSLNPESHIEQPQQPMKIKTKTQKLAPTLSTISKQPKTTKQYLAPPSFSPQSSDPFGDFKSLI